MSGTATPIFPQTINNGNAKIVPADTTNLKTLYTAAANGSRIDAIYLTSTETANNRDIQFVLTVSAVDYVIGTVQVPLNSGFSSAVPTVNAFASTQFTQLNVDNMGNKELTLVAGAVLKAKSLTTLATGKEISILVVAGDF